MKKIILLVIIFSSNLLKAQPLSTPEIKIKAFYYKKKEIFFNSILYDSKINTNIFKNTDKLEGGNIEYISINENNIFLFKNDSMEVKLIFQKYFPIAPMILKMTFQKGRFIIDMNGCVKEKGFFIKNFPCDCMAYRKEEEDK